MRYIELESGEVRKDTTSPHPVYDEVGTYIIGPLREVRYPKEETYKATEYPVAILLALTIRRKHVYPGTSLPKDPKRLARRRKAMAKDVRYEQRVRDREASRADDRDSAD